MRFSPQKGVNPTDGDHWEPYKKMPVTDVNINVL